MIPAWLLTDAARKIGLYLLLTGAFFGVLRWYGNHVRERERAKLADENTQKIEEMRSADRAKVQEVLNEATAKQEAAERRMQASLDRESILVRSLASIQQQRQSTASTVEKVRDSDLRPFNIQQLGVRAVGDNNPCYTPAEERAIAVAITQYPLCQKQVETQTAQIAEIKEGVAALKDKTAALETKLESLAGYTDRLEGYYRVVWEALPRKGRKAWPPWCWAFKCSKKVNLAAPDPISLKQGAPK